MQPGKTKKHMNDIEEQIWQLLNKINDPEIPVLSIIDLGIIRSVTINKISSDTTYEVLIKYTPTYSACPAVDMINADILVSLTAAGFTNIHLEQTLFPAWTTDWMTESGKQKLIKYGIAAPIGKSCDIISLADIKIACPQCGSLQTVLLSEFSSTACKALYKCNTCLEPFDYFKCH
jgi:ring-1,2-phenylacetyl-CoA epoxidase subunit PaaD